MDMTADVPGVFRIDLGLRTVLRMARSGGVFFVFFQDRALEKNRKCDKLRTDYSEMYNLS